MKTVIYEQIWAMELWLESGMDHGNEVVGKTFMSIPQIAWLMGNGYMPVLSKFHDMSTQNITFSMRFDIPDDVATFFLLKWDKPVEQIDFDNMITLIEKKS